MTVLRQTQIVLEVLTQSSPHLRQTQTALEVLAQGTPHLTAPQVVLEVLAANNDGQVHLLMPQIVMEVLAVSYYDPDPITAFTSRLAQPDSRLSGIALGAVGGGAPQSYDNTLTIAGFSAVTLRDGGTLYRTLSVDGISAATLSGSPIYLQTLTIGAIGDFTPKLPYLLTLTIGGFAAYTMLPGQQYNNFAAIEGISNITLTPGIGYFDTVSVVGVSDLTIESLSFTLLTLSIDGIAAATVETLQNGRISLTVAGIAAITMTPNFSYVLLLSLAGISAIYEGSSLNTGGTDGLFNFVALTSNDTITVSDHRDITGNENPSSQGSINVDCTGVFRRIITQTLALTQVAAIKKPTEIVDTFHIVSQSVTVVRVRNQTVVQTLTMTDAAEWYRAFAQSLTFTHTAAVTRVMFRTVSQTLAMTQEAARRTVINRSVNQTLVMGQNRLVRSPMLSTISTSNPSGFDYYQPVAQAILVPIRCLVVLGVPSQTVILPCPQFADSQSRSDTLNLKRTMTGDTYTYVRKTELQKLKYQFQIGTYKAIELQRFLVDHCHELITLINHKGETWYVNLANNPFEFVAAERWQPKGERHDITLEFEGVQL